MLSDKPEGLSIARFAHMQYRLGKRTQPITTWSCGSQGPTRPGPETRLKTGWTGARGRSVARAWPCAAAWPSPALTQFPSRILDRSCRGPSYDAKDSFGDPTIAEGSKPHTTRVLLRDINSTAPGGGEGICWSRPPCLLAQDPAPVSRQGRGSRAFCRKLMMSPQPQVSVPRRNGSFRTWLFSCYFAPSDTWARPLQCSGRRLKARSSVCGPSSGRPVGPYRDTIANS